MKSILLLSLTILANCICGQVHKSDTINYSSFLDVKTFWTIKIQDKKNKEISYHEKACFRIWRVNKPEDILPIGSKTMHLGDTLMFAEWDCERGNQFSDSHTSGKISLNKKSNLITLEKTIWKNNKTKKRKFIILKWTKTQIILLDFSNIDLDRKYIFE